SEPSGNAASARRRARSGAAPPRAADRHARASRRAARARRAPARTLGARNHAPCFTGWIERPRAYQLHSHGQRGLTVPSRGHRVPALRHGLRGAFIVELKGSKTEENLKYAFAGESQANRRYLYFAAKADVEGYNDVSAVFRSTAEGETGHAHGHLEYLEQVGDPATGL